MDEFVVHLQPGFILQHRKYRETSLIIDVLTRDFGIVSILARGVRKKKSKTAGLLLAFNALKFSYLAKQELKILTQVELDLSLIKLSGRSLYCGFYVNELVSCFLHKNDPNMEVFQLYRRCLVALAANVDIERVLRYFELDLIETIGYGFQLAVEQGQGNPVNSSKTYLFNGEQGLIEHASGYISGHTLLKLEARSELDQLSLQEAKQLMRRIIDFLLQGKELKSRAVMAKIIKQI